MVHYREFAKMMDNFSLRTAVSVLLVLICLNPMSLAFPHSARSIGDEHSHRLERLQLLSRRLALNSRLARSSVALRDRTDYLQIRYEKRRDTNGLVDFKNQYTDFHTDLTTFVGEIVQKLKPDAPAGLQKVDVLPKILTPDDAGFQGFETDKKMMVNKFYVLKELLTVVIERVGSQVQDFPAGWFSGQARVLRYTMVMNTMALTSVVLEGEKPEPVAQVTDGGIGGLNHALQKSIGSHVLRDIETLIGGISQINPSA